MEKKLTVAPIIIALEKSFDILNEKLYNGKLKRPVITLCEGAKVRAMGWFTVGEVWHDLEGGSACELNIASDYLKRSFEDIVKTLAHEMVHACNYAEGVQDCARSGSRHNKKFKECAEAHGMHWIKPHEDDLLMQEYYKKYGYSDVDLNDDLKEGIYQELQFLKEALTMYRDKAEKGEKKKSSNVIKYICPVCGASCRATKELHLICGECNMPMEIG